MTQEDQIKCRGTESVTNVVDMGNVERMGR